MSKSRFDKGSTLGNGRWDEEEHPRDSYGRFSSSGVEGKDFTRDRDGNKISVGDTILAHDGSLGKVVEVREYMMRQMHIKEIPTITAKSMNNEIKKEYDSIKLPDERF